MHDVTCDSERPKVHAAPQLLVVFATNKHRNEVAHKSKAVEDLQRASDSSVRTDLEAPTAGLSPPANGYLKY
jgi:hypothetical protein